MKNYITFDEAQAFLMEDKDYAKAYKNVDLAFEITKMITSARIKRNITQARLAKLLNTRQSSISRAESGQNLPSLSFLKRIGDTLHMILLPPLFKPMEEIVEATSFESHSIQNSAFAYPEMSKLETKSESHLLQLQL